MYVHCAVFVYIFPSQVSNLLEPQSTTIKSCFPASSQICSYRLGDFIYFIFMIYQIRQVQYGQICHVNHNHKNVVLVTLFHVN